MDSTIMDLARFLFNRQAKTYTEDADHIRTMWETSDGVREFWIGEAEAIMGFLVAPVVEL